MSAAKFRRVHFFGFDDVDERRRGRIDVAQAGAVTARLLRRAGISAALGLWLIAAFVTGRNVLPAYDEAGRQSLPNYLLWVALVVGAVFTLYGVIGIARWLPRLKSAREGEWRVGTAKLLGFGERHPSGLTIGDISWARVRVRFDDGTDGVFVTTRPTRYALPDAVFEGEQRVWVNGEDLVTILFAYGPFLVAADELTSTDS